MQEMNVALCIIDISGYTKFINNNSFSLIHAEMVITSLLEAAIEGAEFPLQIQKFEGDAALLFAEIPDGKVDAVLKDVINQADNIFLSFDKKQDNMIKMGSGGCDCEGCVGIHQLDVKAFLTYGTIIKKTVKGFEELAGIPVIFIHRILKNTINKSRYILISKEYFQFLDHEKQRSYQEIKMDVDGFGESKLYANIIPHAKSLPDKNVRGTNKRAKFSLMIMSIFIIIKRIFGKKPMDIRFIEPK